MACGGCSVADVWSTTEGRAPVERSPGSLWGGERNGLVSTVGRKLYSAWIRF
jgi:hypothetical protein